MASSNFKNRSKSITSSCMKNHSNVQASKGLGKSELCMITS